LHPAPSDEHDGVLLEVVPDAWAFGTRSSGGRWTPRGSGTVRRPGRATARRPGSREVGGMPRKGASNRREIEPDPVYQNALVTQLINKVLLSGKKGLAERAVYSALETISERTANDPVITLKRAVENARPLLEVRSRRVGGATYQVPV